MKNFGRIIREKVRNYVLTQEQLSNRPFVLDSTYGRYIAIWWQTYVFLDRK
jgi:hypothetical protein